MTKIVSLHHNEPMTTSLAIAEGTENTHDAIMKMVRKYVESLQEFGRVGFEIEPFETAGGVQTREIAFLNEPQATLLITFLRNSEIVVRFKVALVKAFFALRDQVRLSAPANPPFLTNNLSHGADLAVAADRTFRGFMRSARAAGMRLPQALRIANRQTLARTGMDMLAALEIDEAEISSRFAPPVTSETGQVEAFIEAWLDGQLPVPPVVCRSSDLYAAYRQYAKENEVPCPATSPNFCVAARRHERDLLFKVLHLSNGPGLQSSARGVIPPNMLLGIPEGQKGVTNARMVVEFADALREWLRQPTG